MAHADTEKGATGTMKKTLIVEVFTARVDRLKREGHFEAAFKLAETGAPVAGLEIRFRTNNWRIALCEAFTGPDGIAECCSRDPQAIEDVLSSGYNVVFDGNDEFPPVNGHSGTIDTTS